MRKLFRSLFPTFKTEGEPIDTTPGLKIKVTHDLGPGERLPFNEFWEMVRRENIKNSLKGN